MHKKATSKEFLSAKQLQEIQSRIGITFRDVKILEQAFFHRSFLHETARPLIQSNERLEFLGDKIIASVVAQYLYKNFPNLNEGMMTDISGVLVSRSMLGKIAENLGLGDFLLMSHGERKDFDDFKRSRKVLIGNAFEALVGALYLDRGQGAVELFLADVLLPYTDEIIKTEAYVDAKSKLQHLAQEIYKYRPRYELVRAEGKEHKKQFTVAVHLGDDLSEEGYGLSKFEAEVGAAKNALKKHFGITIVEF